MLSRKQLLTGSLIATLGIAGATFAPGSQAKLVEIEGKQFNLALPGDVADHQIVVRFSNGVSGPSAQAIASQLKGRITKQIPSLGYALLEIRADQDLTAAVDEIKRMPGVVTAFKNVRFSVALPATESAAGLGGHDAILNDALGAADIGSTAAQVYTPGSNQWHLTQINFEAAGAAPVSAPLVAVIDTGVDYNNPDLAGRVEVSLGRDFVDGDNNPMDENGHGTHVAGLIAASGTVNAVGVSPSSKILPIRVLDEEGSGTWFDVMAGINYALTVPNVKIINLSLVGYSTPDSADFQAMEKAINSIVAANKLPVVSAGNDDNINLYYYPQVEGINYKPIPAWYPASFTVAATNLALNRTSFSNYNMPALLGNPTAFAFVDIAAPGEALLSTGLDYQYQKLSGTSMSAAVVSGVAARVWAASSTLTSSTVADRIINTGYPLAFPDGFPQVTVNGVTTVTRLVDLTKAIQKSFTGFSGSVINGLTGAPVPDVEITIANQANPAQAFLGKTLPSGEWSIRGIPTNTAINWRISFTKAGLQAPDLAGQKTTANTIKILPRTTFMNGDQPTGQLSVLIDWLSLNFGSEEAYYSYPSKPTWLPYNWNQTAGLFAAPYVKNINTKQVVGVKSPGSISQSPFMRLVNNPMLSNVPAAGFIIKPQAGNAYAVYMQLDNVKGEVNEWGTYQKAIFTDGTTTYTLAEPALKARVYKGGVTTPAININASQATGSGTFWHIVNIDGSGNPTVVNQLKTAAP